jgi:endonuclease/exonuclease/phosphatase family metal-dependent hydrolase
MKIKNSLFFLSLLFLPAFTLTLTAQDTIRLMSFNIWQEGTSVTNGLEKIRDVIITIDPDVVCFAEVRNYNGEDWTTKIVNALAAEGHTYQGHFYGGDVSLISKYPLLSGKVVYNGNGSVVNYRLEAPSTEIVVGCAHLDYTYYACYLPRGYHGGSPDWSMIDDGSGNPDPVTNVEDILGYNLSSKRDEQVAAFLNAVEDDTVPVFLMGDFNEPSWLDWTSKTGTMFDHHGVVIVWQNTKALADSGFTDAFREVFPDEVRNPGITWPSFATGKGSTSWTPKADERDRIDFIFYKGERLTAAEAALVGPRASYAYNITDTTYTSHEAFLAGDLPWPSDHKAVYAEVVIDTTTTFLPSTGSHESFFTVSPNPADNIIRIRFDKTYQNIKTGIYNVAGEEIVSRTFTHHKEIQLSLDKLHPGLHFVRVSADGKSSIAKIMVEK